MTPERWSKIKNIFHRALECAADERAAFLDQTCAGDGELRTQVERMLAADAKENLIIDKTAVESVAQLFARDEPEAITGRTFGHYRVEREIGRGGMGRVYLAQDTRLGRPVALKLMPDAFSQDPERVRRFQQEARVVSALNHPYIMTIHEIGETDGLRYIVSEFVDGETLRDIIARGDRDLSRLLKIVVQVAEALSAAHGVGIVHRDIKPENIMVRSDGYVKVLDFGLAKPSEEWNTQSDSGERQFSHFTTSPGLILGTANYMSPEQARGYDVDARTDIFSFGVVLYEAVTGQAPFDGKTKADTLIAIAGEEPQPINSVIPASPRLQQIIDKALRKNREERYQNIDEITRDLEELRSTWSTPQEIRSPPLDATSGDTIKARPTSNAGSFISEINRNKLKFTGLSLAAILFIGALGLGLYKLFVLRARPIAFSSAKLHYMKLTATGTFGNGLISPDGKYVVYQSDFGELNNSGAISIRQTTTGNSVQLLPARPGFSAYGFTFTPDGNYVYCWFVERANRKNIFLERVPVLPGRTERIVENPVSTASFSPDGKQLAYVHIAPGGLRDLVIADVNGGNSRSLARGADQHQLFRSVAWSPDGKVIAVIDTITGSSCDQCYQVVGFRVADGTEISLTAQHWRNIRQIAWLPDNSGFLISAIDRAESKEGLWLIAYPSGEAQRLTDELNTFEGVSITADGKQILTSQSDRPTTVWLLPNGDSSRAQKLTTVAGPYTSVTWTPDGHIIYALSDQLWIMARDGSDQRQLTFEPGSSFSPDVSPDGRYLVFASTRAGNYSIWRLELASGDLKQLTTGSSESWPVCTPDGQSVIYRSWNHGNLTFWKMPLAGGPATQIGESNIDTAMIAVSPDGQLLAYQYRDNATLKEYTAVRSLEGGPIQGAWENLGRFHHGLQFSADSQGLIYADDRNIWLQPISGGEPKRLTDFSAERTVNFALGPNGKDLLLTRGNWTWDLVLISVK